MDGVAVAGQRDVVLGLLDGVSSRAQIVLGVRGSGGERRNVEFSLPDPAQRRHLTEPAELFHGLGFQFWLPPVPPVLGRVERDGPAARAGLAAGDRIVAIDGVRMQDFREIADYIHARPNQRISIEYLRGGSTHTVSLPVVGEEVAGKRLGLIHVGPPKIADDTLVHTDLSPLGALSRGATEAWDLTVFQARLFWRMVIGQGVAEESERPAVDRPVRR